MVSGALAVAAGRQPSLRLVSLKLFKHRSPSICLICSVSVVTAQCTLNFWYCEGVRAGVCVQVWASLLSSTVGGLIGVAGATYVCCLMAEGPPSDLLCDLQSLGELRNPERSRMECRDKLWMLDVSVRYVCVPAVCEWRVLTRV